MRKKDWQRPADKDVAETLDIAEMCYQYCRPYFDRANLDIQAYEQIIDPASWSTMSEITLGQSFRLVQDLHPQILEMVLWGGDIPFNLIPYDKKITLDVARKVRDNLVYTQRERMNLEEEGDLTLQEATKLGVGYTIVEPKLIQEGGVGKFSVLHAGQLVNRPMMVTESPRYVTGCSYLPFGYLLTTPEARSTRDAEVVTVLRFFGENKLRQLLSIKDGPFKGNADEIIEYAREKKLNGNIASWRNILAYLCRYDALPIDRLNDTAKRHYPVMIPILQQFRRNRHIWIACDKYVIYDVQDKYNTLQCPVVDARFCPDGNTFFTRGIVGRNLDATNAFETWINAMFDFLTLYLHPHIVENRTANVEYEHESDVTPYNKSYVDGDPRLAIHFLTPQQVPPQMFTLGADLKGLANEAAGQMPSVATASPGLVRGGMGALESIMSTSTSRQRLTSRRYENGWHKWITMLTLIYNQILIEDKDEFPTELIAAVGDGSGRKPGERYSIINTVTVDDIRNKFRVEFNYREKLANILSEFNVRSQTWDRLSKSEYINPEELANYLVGDEHIVRRLRRGIDPAKRREEMRQLTTAPQQAGQGATVEPTAEGAVPATQPGQLSIPPMAPGTNPMMGQ